MKKSFASLMALAIVVSSSAKAADCDFSTIQKQGDGYLYSPECNRKVGKMVLDEKDRKEQVDKLNETIKLKDLSIDTNEKRAQLWMDTSLKLEDRVNTIDKMESTNKWLYFGLGVVVFGAAVWGAGKLRSP